MSYAISDNGCRFIHTFEGLCLKSYRDMANIWTIGYGSTRINGTPVVQGQNTTLEEATNAFRTDTASIGVFLSQSVTVPLTQNQVDALFSFCYNVGVGSFTRSSLRKTINGKREVIEKLFTDWNKVRDPHSNILVPVAGLTTRRKAEYTLFSKQEIV